MQTAHKASPLKYRRTREHGRIAKRFSGDRPFPCALSSALFRLPIWRVLERRGAAEPLVYSSTRHSANKGSCSIVFVDDAMDNLHPFFIFDRLYSLEKTQDI